MAHPAGALGSDSSRLNFDRRLKLEFQGSSVTSDAGLLPFRELDDVLGLMVIAGQTLADGRTGRNGRHDLIGMLRQSVFGRLAGYEDVNDADRPGHDPAMRWIVGGRAATKQPELMAVVQTSLLSYGKAGKLRISKPVRKPSGESRLSVLCRFPGPALDNNGGNPCA